MRFIYRFVLVLILFSLISASAIAQENLLENPSFEDGDAGWRPSSWITEGATVFSLSDDAYASGQSIKIENAIANDARYEQTLAVEPDTYYEIRAMVKAEGVDPEGGGANLSIENTFFSSDFVYDTHGEWQELVFYGVTGEDQYEITLYVRLGFYGMENTGTVWFDELSVVKLGEAPPDAEIVDFSTLPPAGDDNEELPEAQSGVSASMIAFVAVASALLIALIIYAFATGMVAVKNPAAAVLILAAGLVVAFAVRVIVSIKIYGYEVDMNCFIGWANAMLERTPSNFYEKDMFCDYPPGYMYVLWLLGALKEAFNITGTGVWVLIKMPQMLADIAAAALIFRASKKTVSPRVGVPLALFYAFMPVVLINSSAWGQIDSILALLLLLTLTLAIEGKWHFSLPVFALAVLVKPQALLLAPLGLVMVIAEMVKRRSERGFILRMLLSILAALFTLVAVAWPFIRLMRPESGINYGILNPIAYLVELYKTTLSQYPHLTINALNLYALLGKNWKDLTDFPGLAAFGWVMFALSFLYSIFLYLKGKDKRRMFLCAAVLLTLVFSFSVKMHERYAFPALLFLIFAYFYDRDIRILFTAAALGCAQFANTAVVLAFEHLQNEFTVFNGFFSIVNIASALFLAYTAGDIILRGKIVGLTKRYSPPGKPPLYEQPAAVRLFRPHSARLNLRWQDYAIMLGVSLVYAAVAFTNLGATTAPHTEWISSAPEERVTFDLGEVRPYHLAYYGFSESTFTAEFSDDGMHFTEPERAQFGSGNVFQWMWYAPSYINEKGEWETIAGERDTDLRTSRYVRLAAEESGLRLFEVAFVDENGEVLPIASISSEGGLADADDPTALIDEQSAVPAYPSYYNSTYFDEIYFARTAYEHLHGMHTYEWTHPPLGKLLIALGIKIFGMTPFGWRFVGTLFGVFMLPLMYLLAKQLIKRRSIAAIAMGLFALDFMHFTQTRLATVDTYGVFFIMLMFFFMLRYTQMNFNTMKLSKTLVPLSLCGLSMGLAIASKWIGLYGAVGLAVLFFISIASRIAEYFYAKKHMSAFEPAQLKIARRTVDNFSMNLLITLIVCLVVFIAVPALIYYASYYPQLAPDNNFSIDGIVSLQKSMYSYHSGLGSDDHPFRSQWYEWPLIIKPIWYYSGNEYLGEPGMVSSISCLGSPLVWWLGFAAFLFVLIRYFVTGRKDRRYLFVILGFCAQYLPWVFVPRSMFIYHYFASVPFIILATALLFDYVRVRNKTVFRASAAAVLAVALALFIWFYPLLTGTPASNAHMVTLKWFDNWYTFKRAA